MDIGQKVRGIIADQLGLSEDEVLPSSTFMDELGADYLDVVEVIMAMEEEFEVEIPETTAESMETVQHLIDFIATRTVQ